MGWQRCALFLAAGTSGVIVSTLFGGDPKDTAIAITAGQATSNAILNIGSGFVQNGLQASYESIASALTGQARTADGLPINHDLARAIRNSHLDAISYLIDGFEKDSNNPFYSGSHRPDHRRFIHTARAWIKAERKLTEGRDFLAWGTHHVAINEVRAVIENARHGAPDSALNLIADEAKREAIEEFATAMMDAGRTIPPEFDNYFDGTRDLLPWSLAAQAFFAQRLKDDERVRAVVFLEQFNALGRNQADIVNALVGLRSAGGDIADRMDAIEEKIETILSRTPGATITDRASLASDLATAVASGELQAQIVRQLLIAHSSLHSIAQTGWQVRERVEELTTRFFGREDVFATLDAFADSRDPGIMILTASAGSGKSACLANWVQRRRISDPNLIYHFICGKLALTTGIGEITGHLGAQLSLSSALGSETGAVRGQNLFSALQCCRHPITLVVDGLDEAASLLQPFIEAGACPPHLRVILSARAAENEWPNYLSVWRRLEQADFPIHRINLPTLTPAEALLWLEDYISDLPRAEIQQLANQLHRSSDGMPLFFSFILEDLLRLLPNATSPEERRKLIGNVPAPFTAYLSSELERPARTEEGEFAWSGKDRKLFALLSILRGPIGFDEIEAIEQDRYPELHDLPHRLTRWLTITNSDGRKTLSFAHPRLAEAFQILLQHQSGEEELLLIEWARKAWLKRGVAARSIVGAAYSVDWLPDHLIAFGEFREAGILLTNDRFLVARLASEDFGPSRLARHISCWFRLSEADWPENGRLWNTVWVENETRLVQLAQTVPFARAHLGRIVMNCVADSGVPNLGTARAEASHASSEQNLLRNQEHAHTRSVDGVLNVGGRLVSWGSDRAIRFWSDKGEPLPGGKNRAHSGSINGVLPVGDRLVSWDMDGVIRFWNDKGEAFPGGDVRAHKQSVNGVLHLGERLVSWGSDGAIRFWSEKGAPLVGGDGEAHKKSVTGVELFGGGLVSWDSGGTIRFWNALGEPLPGGEDKPHGGYIRGVLPFGDRLVSWGGYRSGIRFWNNKGELLSGHDVKADHELVDGVLPVGDRLVSWNDYGAIRFLGNNGERLLGGDARAHRGSVHGVLSVSDRLVSWGSDGAIRFWSNCGEPLPGGDDQAHERSVDGVFLFGHRLVSWDKDGVIRFWSDKGEPLLGGVVRAHRGSLHGVLPAGDRLVSWGKDGAIRFWGEIGKPLATGDDRAHSGWVDGVLPVGDRLVSWGEDGAIRFWGDDGGPMPGGDNRAHEGAVHGVLPVGDKLVSWSGCGAIRFWTNLGEPISGGDNRAHRGSVYGVLHLGERLVSWGGYGAIRFWNEKGESVSGGDNRAHKGSVNGVLHVGDRLVSWGSDGAIRLWSNKGKLLPGGDAQAHSRSVHGVLAVGDRLVSWGFDGAIRFWSNKGEPLPGGDARAHDGWVRDVLPVGDMLVSLGREGAIRFWSHNGEPLLSLSIPAHLSVNGVLPIGDRLVTWSGQGAIRFWSKNGEALPGGDDRAHGGWIDGVLRIGDRLVSWGWDGAIRFWSENGESLPGGDSRAHEGWISGVFSVGGQLVSWGRDGAIRFWSESGQPIELIVVPGGIFGQPVLVREQLVVPGRAMWIYDVPGDTNYN